MLSIFTSSLQFFLPDPSSSINILISPTVMNLNILFCSSNFCFLFHSYFTILFIFFWEIYYFTNILWPSSFLIMLFILNCVWFNTIWRRPTSQTVGAAFHKTAFTSDTSHKFRDSESHLDFWSAGYNFKCSHTTLNNSNELIIIQWIQ